MRRAFLSTLLQIAEADERVMFLTADLGFSVVEKFQERFPERFINVGVSEQNLLAVGTGLAKAGMIPFVYSIIPFVTLRAFEFIRNGPVLHNLPVRIVGVGSGFEYGHDGMTHYGLEDVGVLRTQPNIRIFVPADFEQAQNELLETYAMAGPIYYRLGKNETTVIEGLHGRIGMGRPIVLCEGKDVLFLSCGAITEEVMSSVRILGDQGIHPTAAVVDTVQPLDREAILQMIRPYRTVITVEAHYVTGGLSSAVAEIMAEEGLPNRLIRLGVDRLWDGKTGSEAFLLEHYGLSARQIAKRVMASHGC